MEHLSEECQCEGKFCKKCQSIKCHMMFSKRQGKYLHSYCRPCDSARIKEWKKQHPEQARAIEKRYVENNPEAVKESQRKYRRSPAFIEKKTLYERKHRKLRRETIKKWKDAHPDKVRDARKRWNERHPEYLIQWKQSHLEYCAEYNRQWQRNHPRKSQKPQKYRKDRYEKYYVEWRRRNAERLRPYRYAQAAKRRTQRHGGGGSYTVKEWLDLKIQYNYTCLCCGCKEPDIKLTADHIIPVVKGGSSYITNIQPLCLSCNSRKGAKIIDFRPQNT